MIQHKGRLKVPAEKRPPAFSRGSARFALLNAPVWIGQRTTGKAAAEAETAEAQPARILVRPADNHNRQVRAGKLDGPGKCQCLIAEVAAMTVRRSRGEVGPAGPSRPRGALGQRALPDSAYCGFRTSAVQHQGGQQSPVSGGGFGMTGSPAGTSRSLSMPARFAIP
jgi:hypothetical protein